MSAIWDGLQGLLGTLITFFYEVAPNLGVAIILLTILIGVVLFPLTLKQTRSMKAMQEIQPEVKRLQKELKHDRQAQQAAMMELYRERGINPAAGCLPLILQMPVWFALFSVLRSFASSNPLKWVGGGSALEEAITADPTFQSLDFLWMNLAVTPNEALSGVEDLGIAGGLGTAIPYFITIALVVFTAYWQQKQTMAKNKQPGAPEQKVPGQAALKIMPFFFGFISFNLPAGLVVYFAASQLFRIGQQSLILGLDDRRTEKEPSPKKAAKPSSMSPEQQKPQAAQDSPVPKPATRRPQGSKKKRGKKRRRR